MEAYARCRVCGELTGVPQAFLERPRAADEPDPPHRIAVHTRCADAAVDRAATRDLEAARDAESAHAAQRDHATRLRLLAAARDGAPLTATERTTWTRIVAGLGDLVLDAPACPARDAAAAWAEYVNDRLRDEDRDEEEDDADGDGA